MAILIKKISVIPNDMERYMAFIFRKHLFFIASVEFMNSSLEKLVKNLPKDKFKYFSQELFGKQLELVKQKGVYPCEYYEWI